MHFGIYLNLLLKIVHIFCFLTSFVYFCVQLFIRVLFFENDIIDAFNKSGSRIASVSGSALGRTSDLAKGVVMLFSDLDDLLFEFSAMLTTFQRH
eukprot:UN13396